MMAAASATRPRASSASATTRAESLVQRCTQDMAIEWVGKSTRARPKIKSCFGLRPRSTTRSRPSFGGHAVRIPAVNPWHYHEVFMVDRSWVYGQNEDAFLPQLGHADRECNAGLMECAVRRAVPNTSGSPWHQHIHFRAGSFVPDFSHGVYFCRRYALTYREIDNLAGKQSDPDLIWRRHRRQPETPNVWVRGANGRRVSRGRFRVVGCGAFRLDFDGGLGETLVRWPDRYMDERGAETWARIMGLLDEIDAVEMGTAAE
jgi:hypothetical protein